MDNARIARELVKLAKELVGNGDLEKIAKDFGAECKRRGAKVSYQSVGTGIVVNFGPDARRNEADISFENVLNFESDENVYYTELTVNGKSVFVETGKKLPSKKDLQKLLDKMSRDNKTRSIMESLGLID